MGNQPFWAFRYLLAVVVLTLVRVLQNEENRIGTKFTRDLLLCKTILSPLLQAGRKIVPLLGRDCVALKERLVID